MKDSYFKKQDSYFKREDSYFKRKDSYFKNNYIDDSGFQLEQEENTINRKKIKETFMDEDDDVIWDSSYITD